MHTLDWIVLLGTLISIVVYGIWKSRKQKDLNSYLKGGNTDNWATIGLSVMATQASAITFLSTPGLGYQSGLEFVQFYFGLPLAMIVVAKFFIPIYYKLKVYTAYEYLESRFNVQVRVFTASLFLLQRGLAAGITIYAPSIVLSQILGWELNFTIFFIGILVIAYTVSGGTKAVSQTHKLQMGVIFAGLFVAFISILQSLPISFTEAWTVASWTGKTEWANFNWDPGSKYTVWSGILGGFFLQLSYFGTDQSQVARYLTAKDVRGSKIGLYFNGIVKIPMQFFILLIGMLVFVYYQYHQAPLYFNESAVEVIEASEQYPDWQVLEKQSNAITDQKSDLLTNTSLDLASTKTAYLNLDKAQQEVRYQADSLAKVIAPIQTKAKETDFVFLHFVLENLPVGLIGLLLAMIFSGGMSSTAGELNALASTAAIDYVKRLGKREYTDSQWVRISRLLTLFWGLLAIICAFFAQMADSLVEVVNILGSIFYPIILGVFLIGFFIKFIHSRAVLIGASLGQIVVLYMFFFEPDIEFLWYNLIGLVAVIVFSMIVQGSESLGVKN